MKTPEARLTAALTKGNRREYSLNEIRNGLTEDPTIAADLTAGAEVKAEKRLQFHPLTGDLDFSYASLSNRLDTLERHNESVGFQRGYEAAKKEQAADLNDAPRLRAFADAFDRFYDISFELSDEQLEPWDALVAARAALTEERKEI